MKGPTEEQEQDGSDELAYCSDDWVARRRRRRRMGEGGESLLLSVLKPSLR